MNHSIRAIFARAYGAGARASNLLAGALLACLLATAAAAELRIAALGDSLTQGFGLPEEAGFVPQLEAWLRANGAGDVTVINAGVSGDTTAGGRARAAWVLGEVGGDGPDAVIVALGGNDLLRGLDPGEARANVEAILLAAAERGIPALLAGLPAPGNYGADYKASWDGIWPELAAEHGAALYPNFLGGIGPGLQDARVRALMQGDGIHPNAAGVRAMVEDIGPLVLELVERARG